MLGSRLLLTKRKGLSVFYASFNEDSNISKIELPIGITLNNSSYTVEVKFKLDSFHENSGYDHSFLGTLNVAIATATLHLTLRGDNTLLQGHYSDDLSFNIGTLALNTWYSAAYTFDNASREQKIYFDGSLIASRTANSNFTGTTPLVVGLWEGENTNRRLLGGLEYFRLWDRVLSGSEISTYDNAKIIGNGGESNLLVNYNFQENADDESGNNNNGVATNIIYKEI